MKWSFIEPSMGDVIRVSLGTLYHFGIYVSDSEVEEIMEYLKSQSNGNNYDNDVLEEINRQAAKCSKDGGGDDRDDVRAYT